MWPCRHTQDSLQARWTPVSVSDGQRQSPKLCDRFTDPCRPPCPPQPCVVGREILQAEIVQAGPGFPVGHAPEAAWPTCRAHYRACASCRPADKRPPEGGLGLQVAGMAGSSSTPSLGPWCARRMKVGVWGAVREVPTCSQGEEWPSVPTTPIRSGLCWFPKPSTDLLSGLHQVCPRLADKVAPCPNSAQGEKRASF